MADYPHPPPTPPGYVELARRIDALEASSAQGKRDAARWYVVSDRTDGRLANIAGRLDEQRVHNDAQHHRLLNIEKLLGILVEQGRVRS